MKKEINHQIAHFDAVAEEYFTARQDANHLLFKELLWSSFFNANSFLRRPDMNILEPMCGYAENKEILERYLGSRFSYAGFDYSSNILRKLKVIHPDINVFQQDISAYQPPRETYDLIIIIGGLHHVPHIAGNILKSLAKGLNPGGYFISFEPTHGNMLFHKVRESIYRSNPAFDSQTERSFLVEELTAMFQNAGLTLCDMIYPGLLSYVMYYNPEAFPALNIGKQGMVRTLFKIDQAFMRSSLGRMFSFATLSLWKK